MDGVASGGSWVDPDKIEVRRVVIGALPVVNAVLGRLGFEELLGDYLPEPDPRCAIAPAKAIGVLVRNLCVSRRPLCSATRPKPSARGNGLPGCDPH